jgi:hypothetical protein
MRWIKTWVAVLRFGMAYPDLTLTPLVNASQLHV